MPAFLQPKGIKNKKKWKKHIRLVMDFKRLRGRIVIMEYIPSVFSVTLKSCNKLAEKNVLLSNCKHF